MDKNTIIWVAVVAAVLLIAIIVLVIILRKKSSGSAADVAKDDRELIATNAKSIEALIVLSEDNDEVIDELKDLQEKIKYLMPSTDAKVVDYDKKIKNLIGDLRIALTKSDGEETKKTTGIITDIKLAIADRNTKN